MTFFSSLSMALRALGAHKLRSALTTLGIILGVGSTIVMVAVGAGAQARIEQDIRALGANVMMLVSGSAKASGARLGIGSRPTVSERDAVAISGEVSAVAAAAPVVRGSAPDRCCNDQVGQPVSLVRLPHTLSPESGR